MNMGGRAYPIRHYPIAIRLRDRKGRAILCIALNPQSGDSSGAILGVRSVALLHLIIDTFSYKGQSTIQTTDWGTHRTPQTYNSKSHLSVLANHGKHGKPEEPVPS